MIQYDTKDISGGCMEKTVLITGCSSGIGRETANYFHEKGWNVIATMRNPDQRHTTLHSKEGIDLQHLDVTDIGTIRQVVQYAVEKYGVIDAVVNNAGYALVGPVEGCSHEKVEKQFATNVAGLMDVVREVIPVMRKQNGGTIINLASIGGKMSFPFYSIYNSTKWAIEGFSEGLRYELKPFGIKVRIIEPGLIKTDFYEGSMDMAREEGLVAYDELQTLAMRNMDKTVQKGSGSRTVAKTIYKAAVDRGWKLRYRTGKNAGLLLTMRKLLPDGAFFGLIHSTILK